MSEERLDLILDMLRKDPDDVFLAYAAALEYKKAGQVNKAVELLEGILRNRPDYLGTYYTLGKLYEDRENYERAIEIYKAGKKAAKEQQDNKTIGELTEALMLLDEEEDNW